MTWNENLKRISRIFGSIESLDSFHYTKIGSSSRYLIWQESGGDFFKANNRNAECAIKGTVDIYTTVEFDESIDELHNIMDDNNMTYDLVDLMYED